MLVTLVEPFPQEFFAGRSAFELAARNLFALIRALDVQAPGFAAAAEMRAALVVDGVALADWSTPLAGVREVLIVPKIAGG